VLTPLKLGHVHLKVREIDRAVEFYTRVFGLHVEERLEGFAFLNDGHVHHSVALQELGPTAPAPTPHSIGLYHVAFEVESDDAFRAFEAHLAELGVRHQTVDHGISWATYFRDPDGNGLEVYVDRRHQPEGRRVWDGASAMRG
jgi:catechol 2,3-dioxygenase